MRVLFDYIQGSGGLVGSFILIRESLVEDEQFV